MLPRRIADFRMSLGPIELEMWELREVSGAPIPRAVSAYRLHDRGWRGRGMPVFVGEDFESPLDTPWRRKALELLGFLTLKEGDVEDEFFDRYTARQLRWRDERAEDLQVEVVVAEEELEIEEEREGRKAAGAPEEWTPGGPRRRGRR